MMTGENRMKRFEYVIKDELGIHARPAGLLVKEAKKFESKITIEKAGKKVEAMKLMAVMSMGVKTGETVVIEAEGADEEVALEAIKVLFETNL